MANFNIYSLNTNGLRDETKRVALFNKLKKKGSGIFLLQETHTTKDFENKWFRQWDNKKIIFSHGTSESCGTTILFSDNVEYVIKNQFTDHYCEDIEDFSVDGWIGSNADTEDDL